MKRKLTLMNSSHLLGWMMTMLMVIMGTVAQAEVTWPLSSSETFTITLGSQVTSAADVEDGAYYVFYNPRNSFYMYENSSNKLMLSGGLTTSTFASTTNTITHVFKLTANGTDSNSGEVTYLIQSASGNYMPKPTKNDNISTVASASDGGSYIMNFSSDQIFPRCVNGGSDGTTVYGLDHTSSGVYAYSSVNTTTGGAQNYRLFRVTISRNPITSLNFTFDRAGSTVSDVTVNVKDDDGESILGVTATLESTSCTSFKTGSASALSRTTNSVLVPNTGYTNTTLNENITYTFKVNGLPTSFAYNTSVVDVYAANSSGGSQSYNSPGGSNSRTWNIAVQTGATEAGLSDFTTLSSVDITSVNTSDGDVIHNPWEAFGTEKTATAPLWLKVVLTKADNNGCFPGIGAVKLTYYDPSLAITDDDISVYQGYGTTGRGNDKAVLLRIVANPFKDMENATLTATLTGADNISAVTLYETGNTVEWKAVSSYTNTFAGTISSGTATFDLGANATAGTHYYWLCATVMSNAEVGNVIDAALTGITYNVSGQETVTCNLADVGNPATSMKIFDVQKTLFVPTTYSSNSYRIPAVITADDGSIIAAADKRYNSSSDLGDHKIDVVVRRSTDGGNTWSEPVTVATGDDTTSPKTGYGDPALVKTNTGKLICLMATGQYSFQSKNLKNIAMVTSTDNGVTWTSPVDITTNSTLTDNASLPTSFFVTSGKGLCTSDGVVMFLLDAYNSSDKETNYVLYSTDEGAHWVIDATVVCNGANEAKLQQLKDGSLLASIRTNGNRAFNRGTYTNNGDGTVTFSWGAANDDITFSSTLNSGGGGNNQDILYYSTEDVPDILFHTMTTGNHKNLNLYMSLDQGDSWNHVQTIQPGGSRYAVMNKLSNGDLGILFEDYSLETGNAYPITYLTITAEQIQAWYEPLYDLANALKIADGTSTNGPASYGDANSGAVASVTFKDTWTSNATSGQAGLKLTAEHAAFAEETSYSSFHCLGIKPSAGNATDVITITAPDGYIIKGYYMEAGFWGSSENYTITATEGTGTLTYTTNSTAPSNGRTALNVKGLYKKSTTFTVKSNQSDNTKCLMINKFLVILTQEYPVTLNTVGDASYATLYLPFDVTTDSNTRAYVITEVSGGYAKMTELTGGEIAANTAVVLVNETAATATFDVASGLSQQVTETENCLKGTLVSRTLDLGDGTNYYAMGVNSGKIGFYKFDNGSTTSITLGANKAYLETPASGGSVKGFTLSFDGAEDGIHPLDNLTNDNLRSVNGVWYNLAGQRVSPSAAKGIYIVGGKTIVIK